MNNKPNCPWGFIEVATESTVVCLKTAVKESSYFDHFTIGQFGEVTVTPFCIDPTAIANGVYGVCSSSVPTQILESVVCFPIVLVKPKTFAIGRTLPSKSQQDEKVYESSLSFTLASLNMRVKDRVFHTQARLQKSPLGLQKEFSPLTIAKAMANPESPNGTVCAYTVARKVKKVQATIGNTSFWIVPERQTLGRVEFRHESSLLRGESKFNFNSSVVNLQARINQYQF